MNTKLHFLIRWLARILSLMSLAVILMFIIGERFDPSTLKPIDWVGFVFFPVGISAGMVVAWWREDLGGYATIASLMAFYAANYLMSGRFPQGWAWLVFASPGFLFLLSRYHGLKRSTRTS